MHLLHNCGLPIEQGPRHRPGVRGPRALAGRGPQKNFTVGVDIEIFGIWGVWIVKFTQKPKHVERLC